MWRRTARRTLLLAWLLSLALVAWVGTHPRLLAPLVARLASRNLFRAGEGSLRLRDFRGDPLRGMELYEVSLSIALPGGGALAASIDTLALDYRIKELVGPQPRLRRVEALGAVVHATMAAPAGAQAAVAAEPVRLPRLRLDAFVVRGTVEVVGLSGRLQERITRLALRGAVAAGPDSLNLELLDGAVDLASRRSVLEQLRGSLRWAGGDLRAEDVNFLLNGRSVRGRVARAANGDLDVTVQAVDVAAPEVGRLLREDLDVDLRGDFTGRVRARGDTVRIDAAVDGRLEGYEVEGLRGWAVSLPGRLDWEQLRGRINGALFDGAGRFDFSDPGGAEFWLEGDVADVDLARNLIPQTTLPPTDGHGRLWLHRREAVDETEVSGWLADGFIAEVPFDTCHVQVDAARGVARLAPVRLRYRDLTAVLTGEADTSGTFLGELDVQARDLTQLPAAWGAPRLAGRAQGRGVVVGRDPVYGFEGEVVARDVQLAPLRADSLRARVRLDDLFGALQVDGEAAGDGLSLGAVPLGRFALRGGASPAAAALDSFWTQRGDSVVFGRARATFDGAGGGDYSVDELSIDLEGHRWALEAPARFSVGRAGVAVAEVRLASDLGWLRASGRWDRGHDRLAGGAELRRFDLRLLTPFLPRGLQLAGDLTADLGLSGSPTDPVLSVAADLRGTELALARIDSLHVEGNYALRRATIERLYLATNWGRLSASGTVANPAAERLSDFWPGAQLDLDLVVDEADWGFVDQFHVPALARLAGRFGARLQVGGTTRSPLVAGELTSEPFNVHWLHLQRLDGRVEMTGERLTLADLRGRQGALTTTGRIELPLRADFLSEPTTPLDGPFLMAIDIPDGTDLAPLVAACNAFTEAGGRGGMSMHVTGPLDHPAFSGWARVRDGRCVLRGLAEIYRDVQADGVWEGDWLTVSDLRGASGLRGEFTGDGRLHFRGLMLLGFDLRLDADRVLVASIPELRALVRGRDLHVTGVKVGPDSLMVPRFTGGLEIIQARYSGDFAEKPTVSDPRLATVAPDWLADLHVVGPPRSVLISNRAMELALGGDVDLVRDQGGLWLSGAMTIDAGRMPVFNNDFRVVTGRLDFSRAGGVVPMVDLTAETTVRVVPEGLYVSRTLEKVTAVITGRMDAPSVELSSESGYSRAAVERLLLGLPPHVATGPAAGPAAGGLRDASIAAGFNLLEREIATEFDLVDTVDIESQHSLATGTTHTLIGVGKYLGQDLYVKYAQGLSESERDLLIEYQINDHLLLQSELSRRLDVQQGETTYNLDLKYRFEY